MEKNVVISILYEYYGKLLTDKQAESIEMYYLEDLSLTEIADIQGVSKQNISESIKRSEKSLLNFEESIGLYQRTNELGELVDRLEKNLINDLDDEKYSKYIDLIFQIKTKLK